MNNSYFIYTDQGKIEIDRFHICTWEFTNNTTLIEFGCDINHACLPEQDSLRLTLFIPWLTKDCYLEDFYDKLKESYNSRFIFNDSITSSETLDGGKNLKGITFQFGGGKTKLCVLPTNLEHGVLAHTLNIVIDLKRYNNKYKSLAEENKPNIYVRFAIKPKLPVISTRKKGISKSTILYDIKINERRNIPEALLDEITSDKLCNISSCFCFNIVPNSYDLVFFDNTSLQNVRTLEYESFEKYLGDSRIKKDELIVVFNKKKNDKPFSFFAIYSKERIGAGQFALAILINFICGILLFIPSYRCSFTPKLPLSKVWEKLPPEIYFVLAIMTATIFGFIWPLIMSLLERAWNRITLKRK